MQIIQQMIAPLVRDATTTIVRICAFYQREFHSTGTVARRLPITSDNDCEGDPTSYVECGYDNPLKHQTNSAATFIKYPQTHTPTLRSSLERAHKIRIYKNTRPMR